MTALDAIALALSIVGAVLGTIRWLRVAQREHYLAGSCFVFAARWWTAGAANTVALVVAVAGIVVGIFHPFIAGATGIVTIVAPFGLGIRGRTSKLVWTARLRRIAAFALGLVAVPVVVASITGDLVAGTELAGVLALGAPIIVDFALTALAPFEDRMAMRFVHQAEAVLARVAPLVVGITGSYGKTSTKGYVAHLLASRYSVVASPRSYNNRAGLSRTVNEHLVVGTDVLVAEMGTYGPGEIADLCAWLAPKIAVMTAIGPVHLERFGSLDRTVQAKSEITTTAETVVLNVDDARLAGLVTGLEESGKAVVRCSATDPSVDVAITEVDGVFGWYAHGVLIAELDPTAPALGAARTNVAAAIGVATVLGCTTEEIAPLLGNLPVAENRLARSVASSGAVILDDTFNSNPAGAEIALETLRATPTARRVLVTPGMIELGPLQPSENAAFAAEAATIADDLVIVGRTNRKALVAGARRGNPAIRILIEPTREAAVAWVRAELDAHATVLYENDLPDHYA